MIGAIVRKARQVVQDPVLRHWMVGRALGRYSKEPKYIAHRPPYLSGQLPLPEEAPARQLRQLDFVGSPRQPIMLDLAGLPLTLDPTASESLYEQQFEDTETLLAVHRFAWLPLLSATVDTAWVDALWKAWVARYANTMEGWAWHPYTAAERAINILDFSERFGLPGQAESTAQLLARHASAIAGGLEYFGDHHTSNHLSNNGRGLYRLGLALDLPAATETGTQILINEAARIFCPSGILREGSSHYHLLLTRNYADVWLAAQAHGRPEADRFKTILQKALAVLPHLDLPASMPLIGDISPDAPPAFFSGLLPSVDASAGWVGQLSASDRQALVALRDGVAAANPEILRQDGWMRFDHEPWSGLWHAACEGWSQMPGHGHQDLGGFELQCGDTAVFVDAGRGAYGETGAAARYRSAEIHNTLCIDGADPYPPNRPYYDDVFRRTAGGPPPTFDRTGNNIFLEHHGFMRLKGVGATRRQWQFSKNDVAVKDTVAGTGAHHIRRALMTPLDVSIDGTEAHLTGGGRQFVLQADVPLRLEPVSRWRGYNVSEPASLIVAERTASLPWSGNLTLRLDRS